MLRTRLILLPQVIFKLNLSVVLVFSIYEMQIISVVLQAHKQVSNAPKTVIAKVRTVSTDPSIWIFFCCFSMPEPLKWRSGGEK